MFTSFARICSVIFMLALLGCARQESHTFARIDLTSEELPTAVANLSGLSFPEVWGRWADANIAPSVKIEFNKPLPKKFVVAIKGQGVLNGNSAILKVGGFEEKFLMPNKMNEAVEVFVHIDEAAHIIEIVPDSFVSPQELGVNSDARKLSVGFSEILITE